MKSSMCFKCSKLLLFEFNKMYLISIYSYDMDTQYFLKECPDSDIDYKFKHILYVRQVNNYYFFGSVSLREIMRRATSAARNLAGLDNRDRDVGIPTLAWPPEPSDTATGMYCGYLINLTNYLTSNIKSLILMYNF